MSAAMTHERWLESELRAALSRLAAPASDQLAYLGELGDPAAIDELALEFDDVAEAAVTAEGLLSTNQQKAVRAVGAQLDAMSGASNAELWTPTALEAAAEWAAVRDRAHAALLSLDSD